MGAVDKEKEEKLQLAKECLAESRQHMNEKMNAADQCLHYFELAEEFLQKIPPSDDDFLLSISMVLNMNISELYLRKGTRRRGSSIIKRPRLPC